MTIGVIDRLQTVNVEHDQRPAGMIAFDVGDRAMELALEAAAVENIQQKIGIGGRLQRLDPPLGLGQLDLKPANGLFGTVSRNLRPPRRRTPGGPELARRHAVLAALCGSGCGRLGFLLARHGEDLLKRGLAAIHQDRIVHCGLLAMPC